MNNNTQRQTNEFLLQDQPDNVKVSVNVLFDVCLNECSDKLREEYKYNCLFYLDQFNYLSNSNFNQEIYKIAFYYVTDALKQFGLYRNDRSLKTLRREVESIHKMINNKNISNEFKFGAVFGSFSNMSYSKSIQEIEV